MKHLYAILTQNCNLSCPHCDVKNNEPDEFNLPLFIEQMKKFNNVTLFGGEPTLYKERLLATYLYADSITTNLIGIDDEILSIINELYVATSFTQFRFSKLQFSKWIDTVKKLVNKPKLIVTLSPDTLSLPLNTFKQFNDLFSSIEFEQLIDPTKTQDYYDKVDDWLCNLLDWWKVNMTLECDNFHRLEWYFDCSEQYTLYPDGTLKWGCPHSGERFKYTKCLTCEDSINCRPCNLQCYCTKPKKFLNKLKLEY